MDSKTLERLIELEKAEAEREKAQAEAQSKLKEMVSLLSGEVVDGSAYAIVFQYEGITYFLRQESR